MVSINCPSRAKEITWLPSSEQTGNGGDELAVPRKFLVIYCYILSFFIPAVLLTCVLVLSLLRWRSCILLVLFQLACTAAAACCRLLKLHLGGMLAFCGFQL